jgi:hypothetical protein
LGYDDCEMGEGNFLNYYILKRILSIHLAFSLCLSSFAQEINKVESLDSFFAGIPLQKKYEEWVLHIATHFGIDSINKRGVHSSFKPGKRSHFPFPDSVKVEMSVYSFVNIDTTGRFPNDTGKSIIIQGVFEKGKKVKKDAWNCFNDLKSVLTSLYPNRNEGIDKNSYGFYNSPNKKFPPVMLFRDYNQITGAYYVILICDFSERVSFKLKIQ